jgi:N-acetylmuramoyl-L-alanine amidase
MKLPLLLSALGLASLGLPVGSEEVARAQFSKQQLDSFGYPTNSALAAELGRSEARRDLTNGVVRLPRYGLPAPWSAEFDRILEHKYHVGRLGLGGCLVSEGLIAYVDGYSELSRKFVEEWYGTNLWKEVQAEAEKAYRQGLEPEAEQKAGRPKVDSETYRVRPGDTLSQIARRHGISLKPLQAANPGVDPKRLRVHQVLRLPSPTKASDTP